MKEHIIEVLQQIEREYDVKVLYACESGSRAWGFPSRDSDFDVRFLYVHNKEWYLSIDQGRDVIEVPSQDSLAKAVHPLLDMSGWELTKALRLYRKSNPPFMEWLHSGIVYHEKYGTAEKLLALEHKVFSPVTCLSHYVSMAKRNFRSYLMEEEVNHKKYFTVLRPILAAKWIITYHSIPPIEFDVLVKKLVPTGPVRQAIEDLIDRKKMRAEDQPLKLEPSIKVLNDYLHQEIIHMERRTKGWDEGDKGTSTHLFNELFRELLDEAWK
ncbi:nucleotidyltransferase domain-containing protein [Robertmurraya korlensis]|uniref:nucleotidyltransferase domain-containing protein n=1 Tax=Robertmurraya korlensis TaxID=519977 RepID=UPI00082619D3|nr:nucleotidyltransferase domain-containing protein [Robertmurraya korlensis]